MIIGEIRIPEYLTWRFSFVFLTSDLTSHWHLIFDPFTVNSNILRFKPFKCSYGTCVSSDRGRSGDEEQGKNSGKFLPLTETIVFFSKRSAKKIDQTQHVERLAKQTNVPADLMSLSERGG